MNEQLQRLTEVTAFIWTEADMLDHAEYQAWLNLWEKDGKYIIPIDPALTDYENHLNYAYDDHHMRQLRVERLENGEAISTSPKANTVRSVSRVRILQEEGNTVVLRCAQNLREFRKENLRHYTADVTYTLIRNAEGEFKIQRKIINLINSTDTLAGISYLL
ncbi:aromatic-ring-hydroxylating dioxygenase subunit beta [Acinetobacter puyangensis]|uniref:3-phenylpropionate/cinnamic acid dioxygenase, small subunit n=1 Tax=Acinetobacter puyangensis TaxID=1096779 RepID=A0A240E6D3_9GAMM|nr:aromatic-ring-hydroxylating dioxygenase subunit beta [Acinetobacter puyangensis]SNX43430.1 3-phenylpropionate/cinnamic acid dioxygenase, small subunit [Acinetobacter puyangensis]